MKNREAILAFERSDAYKLLIEPLKQEREDLKHAYDCTTIREMAMLKGRRLGLDFLIDLMEQYIKDGMIAEEQAQRMEARRLQEEEEIDSSTL